MTLTINTNMSAMVVQHNLDSATDALNLSIKRMTTGYKINSAKDDPAGFAVSTTLETNLSSTSVAQSNLAMGSSLISTVESNYDIVIDHLQRIRDLTEQGANGTYGDDSLEAMKAEVKSRLEEIDRIGNSTEFNGIKLLDGSLTNGINLQIGIDSTANSRLTLAADLFAEVLASTLIGVADYSTTFASATTPDQWSTGLQNIDDALKEVTSRQTNLGALQNRLDSAADALVVQFDNLTSSLSTIKDADIATESSNYIKAQILQQASATLLSVANQAPSIALNLI